MNRQEIIGEVAGTLLEIDWKRHNFKRSSGPVIKMNIIINYDDHMRFS